MWIELLGFDVDASDYGVNQLCGRAGFVPTGVTLLLCDPEFVHAHTGKLERVFGPGICSYGGHPNNEDRQRQVWTARDLVGLVGTLQKLGILVLFSHMDVPVEGWLERHPELLFVTRKGERIPAMSPYKRLANGKSYRDFYLPLMLKVVRDFGFDGLHAADGLAHPRIPIYEGDFSDDTVEQYGLWSGQTIPSSLVSVDHNPRKVQKRADWILSKHRLSWIEFHRVRTVEFWKEAASILHAQGKQLFLNSCWTRDPFEALYRYGVDYRALTEAGVDAFFAETAAAVQEYGGDLPYGEKGAPDWDPSNVISRFSTNLSLLRAAAPRAKIIFMNGIKDTNEAWNGIRHAPTNLESEILSHTALFSIGSDGGYNRVANGVISVLSDGLAPHEWKWINTRWDLGHSLRPENGLGAAVYWSDAYREGLVYDYVTTRRCPFAHILWRITAAGGPLLATVRAEDLSAWSGPLLVIHPHLLPPEEWSALMTRKGSPLIAVGGPVPQTTHRSIRKIHNTGEDAFEVSVYNSIGKKQASTPWPAPPAFDASSVDDPVPWLVDLPSPHIADEVFQHVADLITTVSGGVRVLENSKELRAWGYEVGSSCLRVYVRNSAFYYRHCAIDVGRPCREVTTLTAFPANPVIPNGSRLRFKIAGKSMAVFEILLTS